MIRRATILAVGRVKGWPEKGCEDYLDRLRKHFPVEVVEVAEEDMNRRSREEVLAVEAERLSRRILDGTHVIVLDRERGKAVSSVGISEKLREFGLAGRSDVTFILGGPLGISPELLGRAAERWSFGELTLPHALARVVLLEQLYRAVKIERGERYHW